MDNISAAAYYPLMADLKPKEIAHFRFAVLAADVVIFTLREGTLLVRLIPVHRLPHFRNSKGFPGGLIHPSETAEQSATRLIREKARIDPKKVHLEQLYTFSRIDRDPRSRVVAVGYIALVPWADLTDEERRDTDDAWWAAIPAASKLAYDHDEILTIALARLRSRATYTTLLSKFMPEAFTLTELQSAYAGVLKQSLDKRNFRKKILHLNILSILPHKRSTGRSRPAQLYRFTSKKVKEIEVI